MMSKWPKWEKMMYIGKKLKCFTYMSSTATCSKPGNHIGSVTQRHFTSWSHFLSQNFPKYYLLDLFNRWSIWHVSWFLKVFLALRSRKLEKNLIFELFFKKCSIWFLWKTNWSWNIDGDWSETMFLGVASDKLNAWVESLGPLQGKWIRTYRVLLLLFLV